jgi:hypothetical protein
MHISFLIKSALLAGILCTSGCSLSHTSGITTLTKQLTALKDAISAWWYNTPQQIQTMQASQEAREKGFYDAYTTDGIPDAIARIAAHIDRLIQDIEIIKNTLTHAAEDVHSQLVTAKITRKNEIITYLKAHDLVLEEFTKKALYKKDIKLYKFVNVLRTRAFLFEQAL